LSHGTVSSLNCLTRLRAFPTIWVPSTEQFVVTKMNIYVSSMIAGVKYVRAALLVFSMWHKKENWRKVKSCRFKNINMYPLNEATLIWRLHLMLKLHVIIERDLLNSILFWTTMRLHDARTIQEFQSKSNESHVTIGMQFYKRVICYNF
jgi:hypothetical protein